MHRLTCQEHVQCACVYMSFVGSLLQPAGFVDPTLPFKESSCSLQGVSRLSDSRCSTNATPAQLRDAGLSVRLTTGRLLRSRLLGRWKVEPEL
jgi:hypothetical protein